MTISTESVFSDQHEWLIGGGETGRLIRSMNWSRSHLGPRRLWPQSLCTSISLCLESPLPSAIVWGPQRSHIYNDQYIPYCIENHPQSMGRDVKECWPSSWSAINDVLGLAWAGKATRIEDLRIFLERSGHLEEFFFALVCSPIRDESGCVGGAFIQLVEQHKPAESKSHPINTTEPQERIHQLVESNIVGVFSGDLGGRINDANEEMLRIVGYTREDLFTGKMNWKEMTPPEFREATVRAESELRRTGACTPYQKEYIRKDGSRVPVFVWSALVEGAPSKGVAFVLDLSERERTQEALRRSEEQWRDVFENNPTMYFIIDASGTVISVNSVGAEQLGYTVDELIGHSVLQVFPETEQAKAKQHVALCLERPGQPTNWEIRKVRKDGSILWVRETAKAVMREKGIIILIVCEDITERVEAQENLRRSEAFLAEAQKISHTGSWYWNVSSDTIIWSEEHCRIFGLDPKANLVPTFNLFLHAIHPDDREHVQHILDEAVQKGSEFDFEYRIVLPNEQVKYLQGVGKPIVKASDHMDDYDYIGTTMDITAHKHAEEALRQAHNALEKRVQERTRELQESNQHLELEIVERKRAEAVLARRSQELVRSNAELEQLAYIASHDLQEPLRMVASYLQLIESRYSDRLDTDGHEFIGYAVDGAHRMQALIDDLLRYSRIGTKAKPMQAVPCATVVKTAMQALQLAISETGTRITLSDLPMIIGDETQLTQLFQNLIGNAIKFRRCDPPEINIHADSEDGFWRISVRDNGIGIEAEYRDRIFEMFQRLHSSKVYPGNGIGLTICRKIVERHGGRIWVESTPGQGSTFIFTLSQNPG